MTFDIDLRERLLQEAENMPMPGRDPRIAARRAKTLRRHRQMVALAMVAVSAAVIAGAPLLLANEDEPSTTNVSDQLQLPPTGPLDLQWSTAEGGLYYPSATFQGPDGVVYSLSTEPGPRDPGSDYTPPALYRMNDDGSWEQLDLGDGRSNVADVDSGGNDVLYAVSTAPASGGDSDLSYLSMSTDGGQSWVDQEVQPVDPPSDAFPWTMDRAVSVAANGSTVLATVNTHFWGNFATLFPEAAGDPTYSYRLDDAGVTLTKFEGSPDDAAWVTPGSDGDPDQAPPSTVPPEMVLDAAVAAQVDAASGMSPEEAARAWQEGEWDVRTVPWSELGVAGESALSTTQVFRLNGESWEEIPADFQGTAVSELNVSGDLFVAQGWGGESSPRSSLFTSTDGTTWEAMSTPEEHEVVVFKGALVAYPYSYGTAAAPTLKVSTDGGATWTDIDLTTFGAAPNGQVYSVSAGAMGVAVVVGVPDNWVPRQLLVSGDLIDWTSYSVTDIAGLEETQDLSVFVGADRIVVNATPSGEHPNTVTAIGTPVRD
jgi:hypothetical protein